MNRKPEVTDSVRSAHNYPPCMQDKYIKRSEDRKKKKASTEKKEIESSK